MNGSLKTEHVNIYLKFDDQSIEDSHRNRILTINILLPSASSFMYGLTRLSGCRNLGDRTLLASSFSSVALKRILKFSLQYALYTD